MDKGLGYQPFCGHDQYGTVSYLLIDLIFFPNLNNTHGTGSRAMAMKPSTLLAQPIPRFVYTT